jgi:outer membrane protein OmpA-like peptidoglycan-associated protein
VYEVGVIGHTDTLGSLSHNQQLSMKRVEMLRDRLVRDGLSRKSISVASRGQLDPPCRSAMRFRNREIAGRNYGPLKLFDFTNMDL